MDDDCELSEYIGDGMSELMLNDRIHCGHTGCGLPINTDGDGNAFLSCDMCSFPLCPVHAYGCPVRRQPIPNGPFFSNCEGLFYIGHACHHPMCFIGESDDIPSDPEEEHVHGI